LYPDQRRAEPRDVAVPKPDAVKKMGVGFSSPSDDALPVPVVTTSRQRNPWPRRSGSKLP
jgi:hypothetical protein